MEIAREFYVSAAPAGASAGAIVLSPIPGSSAIGEITMTQATINVAAMSTASCLHFIGANVTACGRFLVIVRKMD